MAKDTDVHPDSLDKCLSSSSADPTPPPPASSDSDRPPRPLSFDSDDLDTSHVPRDRDMDSKRCRSSPPSHGDSSDSPLPPLKRGHFSPDDRERLISYKEFIEKLGDGILPAEAQLRYQEYKSQYKKSYFNAHKEDKWLKDKYHPTNLLKVIEMRNEKALKLAAEFFHNLKKTLGNFEQNDFSDAPKAHSISSDRRRIVADVQQALNLVRKLDTEKGIKDNFLCITVDPSKFLNGPTWIGQKADPVRSVGPSVMFKGYYLCCLINGVKLLDPLITYLWHVHGVDYYGMIETYEPKGFRHVRPEVKKKNISYWVWNAVIKANTAHEKKIDDAEQVLNPDERKSGSEWEKKLDSFWQTRLNGQDPLEVMAAKEKIDVAPVEQASKVREDIYFQNYMNDPDALGGKTVISEHDPDQIN